jgi:hypothetical protein
MSSRTIGYMDVTLVRSLGPAVATADETELPRRSGGLPLTDQLVYHNRALS